MVGANSLSFERNKLKQYLQWLSDLACESKIPKVDLIADHLQPDWEAACCGKHLSYAIHLLFGTHCSLPASSLVHAMAPSWQ